MIKNFRDYTYMTLIFVYDGEVVEIWEIPLTIIVPAEGEKVILKVHGTSMTLSIKDCVWESPLQVKYYMQ